MYGGVTMEKQKCTYNCQKGKVWLEAFNDFVDCPQCRDLTEVVKAQASKGVDIYATLRIPKAYQDAKVSGHDLFTQGNLPFSSQSIGEVGGIMEAINNSIYNEEILSLSCYIHTSNLIDHRLFVYGAQKLALEKTMSVVPFISCNTLYALQRVGDFSLSSLKDLSYKDATTGLKDVPPDLIHALDGYRLVQETDLTYYDYISADVCFIEATANTTEKGWTGLADLLGERAKRGLPTYVTGYWNTKTSDYHSKGLRYLLQQSAITRLDLLVPYEVKSGKQGEGVTMTRAIPQETVKPTQTSTQNGLTVGDLLG